MSVLLITVLSVSSRVTGTSPVLKTIYCLRKWIRVIDGPPRLGRGPDAEGDNCFKKATRYLSLSVAIPY